MLTSRISCRFIVLLAPLIAVPVACVADLEPPAGSCRSVSSALLDCSVDAEGNEIAEREGVPDLGAYACTDGARPDDHPTIVEDWPLGRICTERPLGGDTDEAGYCCTEYETSCAYNPIADCPEDRYGFQCRGAYRPETYNPTIHCDQATEEGPFLNYCCSDRTRMSGSCVATAGCPPNLFAWTCEDPLDRPRSQELLASKSRSDTYYMTCSIPTINNNGTQLYCCFTPGIMPPGGTCTQDNVVPDCEPGRFGFACTGPDTPDQSFPSIVCPEPGFAGTSMEGYPANLFCCDFVSRKW